MQVQGTVHLALKEIGERLQSIAPDGSEIPDDQTFLIRPRSFLVIGRLSDLLGEGAGCIATGPVVRALSPQHCRARDHYL